jgi:hypothetical protein
MDAVFSIMCLPHKTLGRRQLILEGLRLFSSASFPLDVKNHTHKLYSDITDIARGEILFFVPVEHRSPLTRLNSSFHKYLQV